MVCGPSFGYRLCLTSLQVLRAYAYLYNATFVGAGDGDVAKDLFIDFAFTRSLYHRSRVACQQRPKRRRLRLLHRIWTEGEIEVAVLDVGIAFLVGDPELLDR